MKILSLSLNGVGRWLQQLFYQFSENDALGVALIAILPFLFLTGGFVLTSSPVYFYGFASYSAVNLSFCGGVHWGMAVIQTKTGSRTFERMIFVSLIPIMTGWLAFYHCLLHGFFRFSLFLLLLSFLGFMAYEQRYAMGRWPQWYLAMRRFFTLVVLLCHLVMIIKGPMLLV